LSGARKKDAMAEPRLEAYRSRFRLDGKTALVLGAASGIGEACAEALAALGATVICADKNKNGVEATAAEIGSGSVHVLDAGDGDAVNALATAVASTHKRLDIAVTTPAIHVRKLMLDYTNDEYDRVADLNLRGTFLFLRAFGRMMTRQGTGRQLLSPRHHARAGARHLRCHQGRHYPDGAWACLRSRRLRRESQRRGAEHRRDGVGRAT
jgi:NAD(P)-dependent dehydrogenase (short-subunit alcohol dehydrogenase family)